ncbi:pseudouridine synthase [Dongshaea marina]|uniref:pseudouridine synthase n=1 Tax=Dongshaea marina TaxID=2047966 RepID=UPI000D3E4228|nr:pseudouridine synthase [Dongshaea marina]
MHSKRSRLDRFISAHCAIKRKDIRLLLAQGRVQVDGVRATDVDLQVDQFSHITLDQRVLQERSASYVMLHKPVGVVSATRDVEHQTVLDLMARPDRAELHLAGRLDLNSSGLMLLTNDGQWSRRLTAPESKLPKRYRVTLGKPLTRDYVDAFARGFYFPYEGITTLPARLEILSDHCAEVILCEGKYHQIKRMFGRFRNPVLKLHRTAIGQLELDPELKPGESRDLTCHELALLAEESASI